MKKSKAFKMYCMRQPNGTLCPWSIDITRGGVWYYSFETVASKLGASWRKRYWHREEASRLAAEKKGWVIVPVEVKEVEPK